MPEETLSPNLDDKPSADPSPAPDAPAAPSTASVDKSLADIVTEISKQNATPKDDTKAPAPTADKDSKKVDDKKEEPVIDPNATEKKEDEPKDPEVEDVPFNDHPRWKEVLAQRNEAKAKVEEHVAEIEKMKPQVAAATALQTYCETNQIGQSDLEEALQLAALVKKDPKAFRDKIMQYVDNIDITLGSKLPPDLAKKVEDGIIDEEHAKELSLYRMKLKHSELQNQSAAQRQQQQVQSQIATTLNTWQVSIVKSDVDFVTRYPLFEPIVKSMWMEKHPTTAAEAIRIVEDANKKVKEQIAKFRPAAAPRKILTTNGSSTNKGEEMKPLDNTGDDLLKLVTSISASHRG